MQKPETARHSCNCCLDDGNAHAVIQREAGSSETCMRHGQRSTLYAQLGSLLQAQGNRCDRSTPVEGATARMCREAGARVTILTH